MEREPASAVYGLMPENCLKRDSDREERKGRRGKVRIGDDWVDPSITP